VDLEAGGSALPLHVEGLGLSFQGVVALSEVSFEVPAGARVAVIGPNGAGKTSLFNCITGFYRPSAGQIMVGGSDVTRWPPYRIARAGVARTFQNSALFPNISVLDNLLVGRYRHGKSRFVAGTLALRSARAEQARDRAKVEEILELLNLTRFRHSVVGDLPHGTQRLVDLGRALALGPRMLLLDEPASGMNYGERRQVLQLVQDIHRDLKITVILIEHDVGMVMQLAEQIVVLDFGKVIARGTPSEIRDNAEVIKAYMGTGRGAHRND
jgi:branched-chain amino acid transport system ATP-binding protein